MPTMDDFDQYQEKANALLKEYVKFYQPQGPAHGHMSKHAVLISDQITHLAKCEWKDSFAVRQYPPMQRKTFYRYDPHDPQGN